MFLNAKRPLKSEITIIRNLYTISMIRVNYHSIFVEVDSDVFVEVPALQRRSLSQKF